MIDEAKDGTEGGAKALAKFLFPFLAAGLILWGYLSSNFMPWQTSLHVSDATLKTCLQVLDYLGLVWVFSVLLAPLFRRGPEEDKLFYDAVTDAVGDAIVVADARGRAVYANAPYVKLATKAGVSRLVGFDVLYSGYTDFSEPVYQLGQLAKDGKAGLRDLRLGAGASAPFADPLVPKWLRLSVAPVPRNSRGGTTLWRLSDITEDRTRQESAFSRLQFIISYLDQAPVGFFSTLPSGKVDYVNATLASWLGYDLGEVQSGKILLQELVGVDAAKMLSAVEPEKGGQRVDRFVLPLKSKSGPSQTFTLLNRADFDASGKALPARCMVMRMEQAAGGSAEAPFDFMSSLPIGFAELDFNGKILTANAPFLSLAKGLSRGSVLANQMDEDSSTRFAKILASTADGTGQVDITFKGSDPRNAHLTIIPTKQGDGTSVFAIDKTDSKLMEAQLAQSHKMQAIGQLSSGLAHDFNNMLTPILGFADLLLTKMRPTDPSFQDVMAIKQNANRAAGLVRHLLAFSRKQTIQPKACDLPDQLSDLGLLLKPVVGGKVELSISHARGLWPVFLDIHQFEQVIVNLASNARDAMPMGGKLSLTTYNLMAADAAAIGHPLPTADFVVLQSTDTGQGIPKEILDKIWDPFFTTKDVGKGTGLGLSMVYGFVKQSGGFIYCDSKIGEGTTFRIFMPRHVPVAGANALLAETKPVEEVQKREDFSGRGRILIVEDEDSVRAFASRALTSRGYTVVEAATGEMGLEVLADDVQGFELILSDVVMPEMDGPTMLKELRKRGINSKFIFMSGYAEDAFEKNPDGPTDYGFIQKPFSLKQLVEKVKSQMG